MSIQLVPRTVDGTLNWATDHIGTWNAAVTGGGGTALGLDTADITTLQAALTAADTSHKAASTARSGSKSATVLQNSDIDSLRDQLAIAVSKIRVFASEAADPNAVYAEADIPPKADPTPAPFPTFPTNVEGEIDNDGNVVVKWTATQVNGDFWSVWRQLSTGGALALIGTTASKKFTDDTVPSGIAWATYRVKSHRGGDVSESSEPTQILFGVEAAA